MSDFDWKYLSSKKSFETTVSINPTRDVTPLEKQPTRGDFWTGVLVGQLPPSSERPLYFYYRASCQNRLNFQQSRQPSTAA